MPDFGGSESQGIGGTDCDVVSLSEWRRRSKSPVKNACMQETELARQRAVEAATTAYNLALQNHGARGRACEDALHAYLEILPDDVEASDQVVKAIILAMNDSASERPPQITGVVRASQR